MGTVLRSAACFLTLLVATQIWAVQIPFGIKWDDRVAGLWGDRNFVSIGAIGQVAIAATNQNGQCVVNMYNATGLPSWEIVLGGLCWGIAIDPSGDTLVATGSNPLLVPLPPPDAAVHKLDSNGSLLWTVSFTGFRFPPKDPLSIDWDYNRFARYPLVSDSMGNPVVPLFHDSSPLNAIEKLSTVDGSVIWSYLLGSDKILEMVNHDGNTLYGLGETGGGIEFLLALDKDGNALWNVQLPGDAFGLIAGPGVVCYSEGISPTGSNYTSPKNACRSKTTGALLWEHAPAFEADDDYWSWNYKAFAGDGTLHVAWTATLDSTIGTRVFLWKYGWDGALLWDQEYTQPSHPSSIYPPDDEARGLGIENGGLPVLTLTSTGYGTGAVVFWNDGTVLFEDFTPVIDQSNSHPEANSATDFLGYAAVVDVDDGDLLLQRFGRQQDAWENDKSWIWAHPWVHPAGPPQYHNFYDDIDDWISFHARAGQTYRVTTSVIGSSLPGLQTRIYSGNGQTPRQVTAQAELLWTAPSSGSRHVRLNPIDDTSGPDREYSVMITGDQNPSHVWSLKHGLTTDPEHVAAALLSPDGGAWILGHRGIGNGRNIALHRVEEDGLLGSSRYFDTGLGDEGRGLALSAIGNPVIAASTESFATADALLMELDGPSGTPQIVRRYDMGGAEAVHALVRAEDGYYLLGSTDVLGFDAIWLLRLTLAGEIIWSRVLHYGNASVVAGYGLTLGHELVTVAGKVNGHGLLMRIHEDGSLLWSREYANTLSSLELTSVVESADGRLTAVGTRSIGRVGTQLWVLSTDAQGDPLWNHSFNPGRGGAIVEDAAGGFVAAGTSLATSVDNGWLIGLDAMGNVRWERAIGDAGSQSFSAIDRSDDGGFFIAGQETDMGSPGAMPATWSIKTDGSGQLATGCSMVAPTSTIVADVDLTVTPLIMTEDPGAPSLHYDDPISWGDLTNSLATGCELHEPGDVGTSLVFDDSDTMSWGPASHSSLYSIYRSDGSLNDTQSYICLATDLTMLSIDEAEVPPEGVAWSYVVVGKNELGEGPMGLYGPDLYRPHPGSCPP